jgi:Ran GTPase-activating protein (RanGAP) involved in mRNA processing and transport
VCEKNVDDWDFHEKELSDADLKITAGVLTRNKSCSNLDLRHNKITHVGAHYLSQILCVNYALKALLLSYNNIADGGLRYLCDAMADPLSSLELLYFEQK